MSFLAVAGFLFNFGLADSQAYTAGDLRAMIEQLQSRIAESQRQLVKSEPGSAQFSLVEEISPMVILKAEELDPILVKDHHVFKASTRLRRVMLTPEIIMPDVIKIKDHLVLNLFPDTHYRATIDRVLVDVNGVLRIRGRLQEHSDGYIIMAIHRNRTLASISIPKKNLHYLLFYEPQDKEHYIVELDSEKLDFLEPLPPLIPSAPTPEEEKEIMAIQEIIVKDNLGPNDPATINVMIVYTELAEEWTEIYRSGIHAAIAVNIEKSQLVFDNSDTGVTLQLVHSAKVDYDEADDSSVVHVTRLSSPNDGYMDEVHEWRDKYAADLVSLFAILHDSGGATGSPSYSTGNPRVAFSVIRIQQITSPTVGFAFVHEIGHNLGASHHKEQFKSPGPNTWFDWPENTWSAGWRWLSPDEDRYYCSVMTYCGPSYFEYDIPLPHYTQPYFSNPNVYHEGKPTGHPEDGDNARTIREMKHVIAAYRQEEPSVITEAANYITLNSATLNMNFMVGVVAPVEVRFRWRQVDTGLWTETSWEEQTVSGSYGGRIYNLEPDTTYKFYTQLKYKDIIIEGDHLTFITPSPIFIKTCGQLQDVKNNLAGHYVLVNDIDCSDTENWNKGAGFEPIGEYVNYFRGTFDGQGYTISDLYINRPDRTVVGLFASSVGPHTKIKNVGLVNFSITGLHYVGGLAGVNGGEIRNVYVTGNISGNYRVGGLVGLNSGLIVYSYAISEILGGSSVGGLVGAHINGDVKNVYFKGNVSGNEGLGGLIGKKEGGRVLNSYSVASVSNVEGAGGLIGFSDDMSTVVNSFWDVEISDLTESYGGTGKTTKEMMNIRTFNDSEWSEGLNKAWNIAKVLPDQTNLDYVWNILDGEDYPFLSGGIEMEVYNLAVKSSPVTGIAIDGATGYGDKTNYIITGISPATHISLTAPLAYNGYQFARWTGCDLTKDNTCTLTLDKSRTVTAYYEEEPPVITLEAGWNLFSPSVEEGITISAMETGGCSIEAIYSWDSARKRYSRILDHLKPGTGYWVAVMNDCTFFLPGTPSLPGTPWHFSKTHYSEGTHLIGSAYEAVEVADILGTCPPEKTTVKTQTDFFNGTYEEVDTLLPFKAYWLELEQDCSFGVKPEPSLTLISPNGGEKWEIGKTYPITWRSQGISKVDISACGSEDPFSCMRIGPNEGVSAHLGKYDWTIKQVLGFVEPGSRLKIRITEHNNAVVRDFSDDYFSIVAPPKDHTLRVGSFPVTGITIGSTTGHSGITNYTKTGIPSDTIISLNAPSSYGNYAFSSWTGCDRLRGRTGCILTINSNRTVTVNYRLLSHALSVTKSGTGSGAVTSEPAGINCGNTCSASYDQDTSVTLTATPDTDSTFVSWSGACTGTTCTVTMDSNKSVTATFELSAPVPQECTTYNNYLYCRGFKSTDPQGSSCNAACSERGYTCPAGDSMFRSLSDIVNVATALGVLAPGESYRSLAGSYSTSYIRKIISTGAKQIYYNSGWNQSCTYAPRTDSSYERVNICRCQEVMPSQSLKDAEYQLASLNNIISQLIDSLTSLIKR